MAQDTIEPTVTINGHLLTPGQALVVREALQAYALELVNPDALGADDTSRAVRLAYLRQLDSLGELIAGPRKRGRPHAAALQRAGEGIISLAVLER